MSTGRAGRDRESGREGAWHRNSGRRGCRCPSCRHIDQAVQPARKTDNQQRREIDAHRDMYEMRVVGDAEWWYGMIRCGRRLEIRRGTWMTGGTLAGALVRSMREKTRRATGQARSCRGMRELLWGRPGVEMVRAGGRTW